MQSKLKNVCVIIEKNTQIDKVIYNDFHQFKSSSTTDFLENQIINCSCFDENNVDEEVFFKVYVHRYLSHVDIVRKYKNIKSDDLSALIVVRINDENKNDLKSFFELSFHNSIDDLNSEVIKVQYMTFIRMINEHRKKLMTSSFNI